MKALLHIEWLLFTRNKMQLFLLTVFILAALYAMYYGNAAIDAQQATLQSIQQQNNREQQQLMQGLHADTSTPAGMAAYEKAAYPSKVRFYLNYYAIDEPSGLSRLCIGQRDVHPYYLPLNAQNLYLQLFKSEIANPRKLLAGNFDWSFVIIYLLPLLIIAFTYNLLPLEKEQGTFPLLKIQVAGIYKILMGKMLFRLGIVSILLLALSLMAFGWSGKLMHTGWWLLVTGSYTVAWFAWMLLVNACNRSSAFNAMASLSLWLLFLVLMPSLLNLAFTEEKNTDPTKLADFIRRRQGMGESKQEKMAVLQTFYRLRPEYKPEDTAAANRFIDFQAYSAFVTLLDAEAKPAIDAYFQRVWQRNQTMAALNVINPAVNTQNMLNAISGTGLENAFAFRESITRFHAQLSHFCFAPLFAGRMMTKKDYDQLPVFKAQPYALPVARLLKDMGWLWLLTIGATVFAYFRFRQL